ncbi:MAG: DUF547 domain-containing protein [Xanthomonadaceae bacterium]|nr:DUF547 domain-containing protein [Xanthomonadaceae bacterium]
MKHASVSGWFRRLLCALPLLANVAAAQVPSSGIWNVLLARHVVVIDGGHASRVDYAGMRRDKALLDTYTRQLSAVTAAQFDAWGKADRMAFLINAYNAFTVEKVLTRWPDLHSIKDLGSFLASPWRDRFFTLLGRRRDLDDVEGMLRAPGRYDDPRIHFALNCASIGCPMLQPSAYDGAQLGRQLDAAVAGFLGDSSRNRYDPATGALEVSRIFDWYADDFSRGPAGSVKGFLAAHAASLSDDPAIRQRLRAQSLALRFLPYDWRLNGVAYAGRH